MRIGRIGVVSSSTTKEEGNEGSVGIARASKEYSS